MDVVPSIWLSSVAGAILFFASGRLWARPSAEGRSPGSFLADPALEDTRQQLAHAERALTVEREAAAAVRGELVDERARREQRVAEASSRAAGEIARLSELCDRLQREAVHLRSKAAEGRALTEDSARVHARALQLSGELDSQRLRLHDGEAELGRARAALAAAGAETQLHQRRSSHLEGELGKSRAALEEASSARRRLEGELARQQRAASASGELEAAGRRREASLAQELNVAAAALERLRSENGELRSRVQTLDTERLTAAEGGVELHRKNLELSMKLRVYEQRGQEFERKSDENDELRRRVEVLADASREAADLRRRVSDLEAQGFARAAVAPPVSRGPIATPDERLETVLERSLEAVCRVEGGCRTAVLSDIRGLLIASTGDRSFDDELAAIASLTSDTAERFRELLPVGAAVSLELRDENQIVVRTRWLRSGDECFLLSTIGLADGPASAELGEVQAELCGLLGAR